MLSLLRLERKQKNSSNPFRIRIFLFLSYSFGIETINTFIHSVVPSKTIPDSRPKWAKCIPVFRPKRRQNHTRWGGTYLCGYKGVPPPPPPSGPTKSGVLPFPSFSCKILSISKSAFISFASVDWVGSRFLVLQPREVGCLLFFVMWRFNSSTTVVHCRIFVHQGYFKKVFITISDSRKTTASSFEGLNWITAFIKSNRQVYWNQDDMFAHVSGMSFNL